MLEFESSIWFLWILILNLFFWLKWSIESITEVKLDDPKLLKVCRIVWFLASTLVVTGLIIEITQWIYNFVLRGCKL